MRRVLPACGVEAIEIFDIDRIETTEQRNQNREADCGFGGEATAVSNSIGTISSAATGGSNLAIRCSRSSMPSTPPGT